MGKGIFKIIMISFLLLGADMAQVRSAAPTDFENTGKIQLNPVFSKSVGAADRTCAISAPNKRKLIIIILKIPLPIILFLKDDSIILFMRFCSRRRTGEIFQFLFCIYSDIVYIHI